MPASLPIDFCGERLILLADRAIHWPAQKTLLLADVHLGKDASFRAAGLPVPVGNSSKDLARIESILKANLAERLIILGDLVHNKASHQPELASAFSRWRAAHAQLDILLIRGNHDRHAGPVPADWNISEVSEPHQMETLVLAHKPLDGGKRLLCGHIHPTIAVRDFDGTYATLCCFVADENQLILPAFGSFTGGCKVRHEPGNRIFAIAGKSVVQLRNT
jgi:DNA ligase-associated metallophosphoesterase